MCDLRIDPMTVNTGQAEYPDVNRMIEELGVPCLMMPVLDIARELKNLRVVNVILLGAASKLLPEIPEKTTERPSGEKEGATGMSGETGIRSRIPPPRAEKM